MPRMYHPDLGVEETVPDDEGCVGVLEASGWKVAPEPEARPGYQPEPNTYEPVKTEAKPKRGAKPADEESSDS